MRLSGKFAVVTGGSSGIGFAIAKAYVREGAEVGIVGSNLDRLESALASLGSGASAISADLATEEGVKTVIDAIAAAHRTIDTLVNNAGRAFLAPFETVERADYEALMALNVTAPYFLTQGLLPHMRVPGASVINLSSYFADKNIPGRPSSPYSISKGAMDALTKTLAFELGPLGIRVNAIAPGTTQTQMRRNTVENLPPDERKALERYVEASYPLGRIGEPEDFAGLAIHLASEEAAWTSGAVIAVDGGYTCG